MWRLELWIQFGDTLTPCLVSWATLSACVFVFLVVVQQTSTIAQRIDSSGYCGLSWFQVVLPSQLPNTLFLSNIEYYYRILPIPYLLA
jgi:hypothetical protein